MKNKVVKALKITKDSYEKMVIENYLQWCGKQAADTCEYQQMIANASLFSWWNDSLSRLELEFLQEIEPYTATVTPREAKLLYIKNVIKIDLYFSKPLKLEALKLNIIGGHE